jgi:hypothetical protein
LRCKKWRRRKIQKMDFIDFYRFLRLWSGNKGFRRLWSGMKGFKKGTIGWTKNHLRHHLRQTGHVNIPVRWVWSPGGRRSLVYFDNIVLTLVNIPWLFRQHIGVPCLIRQ